MAAVLVSERCGMIPVIVGWLIMWGVVIALAYVDRDRTV
jgi:hypothetical protein